MAVAGGAVCALGLLRQSRRARANVNVREVQMVIVPWGIVVDPNDAPRILRWPAIREVIVEAKHALSGGTPSTISSFVTIKTEHDALLGHAMGSVGLESLVANWSAYAEEASRPPSVDLEGMEPLEESEAMPSIATFLRRAEELCVSSQGAAHLSLLPGGYRAHSTSAYTPETILILRRSLRGQVGGDSDPRVMASILAGLLGVQDVLPELVRLSGSPHPMVAAVARAAALRLGVMPAKVGRVEEIAEFLFEEDLEGLRGFAQRV